MTVLAQIEPLDILSGTRSIVRLQSEQDVDAGGYAGEVWFPGITRSPSLGIQLFRGNFDDPPALAAGEMVIADTAQIAYPVLKTGLLTKAPITLWKYESGTVRIIFRGVIDGFRRGEGRTTITLSVADDAFDADLLTLSYAGTTGKEGPADLKGQVKPWAFGTVKGLEPVLINAVDSIYQVSAYGPITAIDGLFEAGASFGASKGDYASYAALQAAELQPAEWATCLAEGMLRKGAPAAGVITCDVRGETADRTGTAIKRMAAHLGLTDRLDTTTFDALDANKPYDIGFYLTQQTGFLDQARKMVAMCNAICAMDFDGTLFVSQLTADAPVLTLDKQCRQMPPVREMTEEPASAPYSKVRVGAVKCWRVHSLDEIAFAADLLELGLYETDRIYREGNIVSTAGGSRYLYIATTAQAGVEPGTDSNVWRLLSTASALNPTGDYDNTRTYQVGDLALWTDGNLYARIGEGATTGVPPTDGTKWAVFLEGGSGTPGQDGVDGTDGLLVEFAFRRSATQPATPIGNAIPTGWSDDPPADDGNPLWMTTAKQELDGTLVGAWSVPRRIDGEDGLAGYNTAQVTIYTRSASLPTKPTGTVTWTFSTKSISGLDNGWSLTQPADNGNPLWASGVTFVSRTDTDTADGSEFAAPVGLPGGGADGLNQATVFLFKRSATLPSKPTANVNYTFSTKTVSNLTNGWTQEPQAANGNPEYVIAATASAINDTDTIPPSEFSEPVVFVRDGASAFALVNLANTEVGTNYVQKIAGGNSWNAGAYTREAYVGGASFSFQVHRLDQLAMIGLNDDPAASSSFTDIELVLYQNNDTLEVRRDGTAVLYTHPTKLQVGNVVQGHYDNARFRVLLNGIQIFETATTADRRYFLDASILTSGGRIEGIAFSPAGPAGTDGADGDDGVSPISVSAQPEAVTINREANGSVAAGTLPIVIGNTATQAGAAVAITGITLVTVTGVTVSRSGSTISITAIAGGNNGEIVYDVAAAGQMVRKRIAITITSDGSNSLGTGLLRITTPQLSWTAYQQHGGTLALNASETGKMNVNLVGIMNVPLGGFLQFRSKIQYRLSGGSWVDVAGSAHQSTPSQEIFEPNRQTNASVNGSGPYALTGLVASGAYEFRALTYKESGSGNSTTVSLTLSAEQVA